MLALGVLAVCQVLFIPGLIVLRALGMADRGPRTLILACALSLLINHVLVLTLVVTGLYQPWAVYLVIGAELAWLWWPAPRQPPVTLPAALESGARMLHTAAHELGRFAAAPQRLVRGVPACAAYAVLGLFVVAGVSNFGQIFSGWDDVVSWNRWAIAWAGNRLPEQTWEYPQLLPSNWSLTYVAIRDTEIWFFAKSVMSVFAPLILLITIDLYRHTKESGYLVATVVTAALFLAVVRYRHLSSGYADVPVAFFAFAAAYLLILARSAKTPGEWWRSVLLSGALAAGAALTKQAGLWIVAVFPLLTWGIALGPREKSIFRPSPRQGLAAIAAAMLLIGACIAPWYLYKHLAIRGGHDASVIAGLTQQIHGGRSLAARVGPALDTLLHRIGLPVALLLAVAVVFALCDRVARWLVLLVVLPYTLIWVCWFSYDLRNLTLALPFVGLAAGLGIVEMRRRSMPLVARFEHGRWPPRIAAWNLRHATVLFPVALVIASGTLDRREFLSRQLELQKRVGVKEVNQGLYEYTSAHGLSGAILTDYLCLEWLPELKTHYRRLPSLALEPFCQAFHEPDVEFALLHRSQTPPEVWRFLDAAAAAGTCELILETKFYRCYHKRGELADGHRRLDSRL